MLIPFVVGASALKRSLQTYQTLVDIPVGSTLALPVPYYQLVSVQDSLDTYKTKSAQLYDCKVEQIVNPINRFVK